MGSTINQTATIIGPQTMILPANDREAAEEFSAVIIPYSVGEVAQAAKRGKDAAKKWKSGKAMPCGLALMHMARRLPAVRNYMLAKMGPAFQHDSPQSMSMAVLAFQTLLSQPGPEGDALRAMIKLMTGQADV